MVKLFEQISMKTFFLTAVATALMLTVSVLPAGAQSRVLDPPHYEDIPGCRANVMNAIKYAAKVNAIRDHQLAEETLLKPESVVHMTCFATAASRGPACGGDDQLANASPNPCSIRSAQDRYLWQQTGWPPHMDERVEDKVRVWALDVWLRNYQNNIIGDEVNDDCRAIRNLWDFLTGNGAKRSLTEANGSPSPGGGFSNRQDDAFFISTGDLWEGVDDGGTITGQTLPTDAHGARDQRYTVIRDQADAAINTLEDDMFNYTDDIQLIMTQGHADFSSSEGGFGCSGQTCLIGQNTLNLFNTLNTP